MMKKLPILTFAAAAAVLGSCGIDKPADTTDDGINPPPLPDETDVCSGMEDENFKKYCLENFDTDKDGKISRREAELVKEIEDNDGRHEIISLKGIEYFTNLETLFCGGSAVEAIDLHYNTKITVIPENSFVDCCELTEFVLPPNITSVGEGAFLGDEKLAGFYGNLASEDNRCLILDGTMLAFAPAGLTTYSIPEEVKAIGPETNFGSELTELRIPDSVTSVAEGAISHVESLKAIYSKFATDDNRCLIIDGKLLAFAPAGLTAYSIPQGVTAIGYCAFMSSGLTSVNIPDGVKNIGENAFSGCRLTTVTIPKSVTSIGRWAFDCDLESVTVTVEATTPPALEYGAFGYVGEYYVRNLVINVPKAAVDTYKTADGWEYYADYIKGI